MKDHKWLRLLTYVAGLGNRELLLQNEYLAAENRILRAHLPARLRLSDPERSYNDRPLPWTAAGHHPPDTRLSIANNVSESKILSCQRVTRRTGTTAPGFCGYRVTMLHAVGSSRHS